MSDAMLVLTQERDALKRRLERNREETIRLRKLLNLPVDSDGTEDSVH